MSHDRYDIHWVGRCQFVEQDGSNHDKIWGWFLYKDLSVPEKRHSSRALYNSYAIHAYVFYARTGKTPSFKKHSYSEYAMNKLVRSKTNLKSDKNDKTIKYSNYVEMSVAELLEIWPTLYEELDNKFVFQLLAENI